ncbi:MAG: type 4a pilus biogenesis protein PilO [Pirellulales bacterium]
MSSPVIDQQSLRFGRLLHYAGLAIVLIVGATAYNWFYTPLEKHILDTQLQIEDLEIMGRNAAAIRREHTRLTEHLKDIEARYAALESRVPLNAEAGSFLKHVSEIAHEERLEISNFQPAQSIHGNGYTAMEVMLDGKGAFPSICSFFQRLSKIQRLSKVKDLSVSVDPQADEYPMKATIVIYFGLKSEEAAAAGAEVSRG